MNEFTRRGFLKVLGAAGAVGAGAVAVGCGGGDSADTGTTEAAETETAAADEGFTCMDTTGLTEAEVTMRTTLEYTDVSPVEGQNCANCALYVAATADDPCGTCQTVKGPIHPLGYCTIWAQMTG